ncbi:hypothetical protein MYOV011v1_p0308 [Vibrio phage 6E35.1a]|nr:hypothetical protein MYOV011v1_p0308 [Vibrio phage 6E35.1a]
MKTLKTISLAVLLTFASASAFAGGTMGGNPGFEMCKIGAIKCGVPLKTETPKADTTEVKTK